MFIGLMESLRVSKGPPSSSFLFYIINVFSPSILFVKHYQKKIRCSSAADQGKMTQNRHDLIVNGSSNYRKTLLIIIYSEKKKVRKKKIRSCIQSTIMLLWQHMEDNSTDSIFICM